jgi:hypothetical protein
VDGGDVFVTARRSFPPEPAETYISSPPANVALEPARTLSATAQSLRDGSVKLYVEVPGAGELSASAEGAVVIDSSRHAARASAKRRHRDAPVAHKSSTVAERDVALAKKAVAASNGGLVEVTLTLASSYRALAAKAGGLSAKAQLLFTSPGEKPLHESIEVLFLSKRKAASVKKSRASGRRVASGRERRR